MSFSSAFQTVTGNLPYAWQERLADDNGAACESKLIDIPTGLGKTAGVVMAWLWNRVLHPDADHRAKWPRRLVYCLPMRTLVEQTEENATLWLLRLGLAATANDSTERAAVLKAIDRAAATIADDENQKSWRDRLVRRSKDDPADITGSLAESSIDRAALLWLVDHSPIILMGGEDLDEHKRAWDLHPEKPAILIGTQDMLLSRALNRGYGMSRYRWPMHFALLNNDCLWVMDEVQLMGAGVQTARQLEAFRREGETSQPPHGFSTALPSVTWYCSATTSTKLLNTREWRDIPSDPAWMVKLTDAEKSSNDGSVAQRTLATKHLDLKKTEKLGDQASNIFKQHRSLVSAVGSAPSEVPRRTLVICNTVDRAVEVYGKLLDQANEAAQPEIVLLHSRFRPKERREHTEKLSIQHLQSLPEGQIVVSTQVIEAGVDISSGILWTEVAPLSALVQRFGRINRSGEFGYNKQTTYGWLPAIHVVGVGVQSPPQRENADARKKREDDNCKLCLPYDLQACEAAWAALQELSGDASLANLANISDAIADSIKPLPYSLQRHELLDFFDTDSNLSLGYTDVSPFVRGPDEDTDVYVLWREWDKATDPNAHYRGDIGRDEICSVPISRVTGKNGFANRHQGFLWLGKEKGWVSASSIPPFAGCTLLLPCDAGGYATNKGWTGNEKDKPDDLHVPPEMPSDEDMLSFVENGWQSIDEHTRCVQDKWDEILRGIGEPLSSSQEKQAGDEAVIWHDFGKNHPRWQLAVLNACDNAGVQPASDKKPWGKFDLSGSAKLKDASGQALTGRALQRAIYGLRRSFRPRLDHEVASALALRQHHIQDYGAQRVWDDANRYAYLRQLLAEYLVMSHHGGVRKVLRDEIPRHPESDKDTESVRGIQHGQEMEGILVCGTSLPATTLSTDCRKMGRDGDGHESYTRGVLRLLDHYGPFRLAYFEALFRAADIRASKEATTAALSPTTDARVREDAADYGATPLTAAEKSLVAALVEDGLAIQDRFRAEPLYRDTGRGHFESRTVEEIEKAKQERKEP